MNKSLRTKVALAAAGLALFVAQMACDNGPTVIDTADSVSNAVQEVTNITKAFGPLNEQLFGSDGQPQCVYTYRSGEQITKSC